MNNIIFCIEGNEDLKAVRLNTVPHIGDKITLNFFNDDSFFDGDYKVINIEKYIEVYSHGATFEKIRCVLRPMPKGGNK